MALTKNQTIAAVVGCVGCLGIVFIVLVVGGGLALIASGDREPQRQEQQAPGGEAQPLRGQGGQAQGQQGGQQVDPGETVRRQLVQAGEIAQRQGYSSTGQPATGALRNGTQEDVAVNLTGGGQYLMVGVCDGDCTDLDLRLFSPDGREIAQDLAVDDTPVLQFTAPASGQHRARVVMVTCSVDPCGYGVALYARQ